ncbi:MAG: hypothetical protein ACLQU9_06380 [Acidimicrobiales bacterium]|jgi:hypothetical protein
MAFQIFVGYPPDRESPEAQLHVSHDGVVDIPAIVYRDGGQFLVDLFSKSGGPDWTYPVVDLVEALNRAVAALDT